MRQLEDEGITLEDRLSFRSRYDAGARLTSIRILGRLRCHRDVSVQVDKTLAVRYVRGVPQVRGIDYAYHAWLAATEQDILRYDMAHGEALHCHVFDLATGESALLPVPLDMLPSLDGFVRMACRLAADASRRIG